jgi:hypothetical protein
LLPTSARGFPGQSAEDLLAENDARHAEDAERDRELDAARRSASPGEPSAARNPGSALLDQYATGP